MQSANAPTKTYRKIFLVVALIGSAMAMAVQFSNPHINHLAKEKSRYLRQHSKDPIEWYPWGESAFNLARNQHKPIFLSIGFSSCYWCHVMERESFSNPEIARYMNGHFVNVQVDREERPDVDDVYVRGALALNGSAGWPLT
ncbi:MAG: thioredoxin domain-containing protein, partial [Candidatus Obscuribacterales bacterium]|nr:thioredoxin domain-containing protein [Candidatus Obscuribacterales bacterium]